METSVMKQLVESAIQCTSCMRSINDDILYRCVECNDNRIYCEECGQFVHQRQQRHHGYSGINIRQVQRINETQLQSDQNQGERYLHYLISQYHIATDTARINIMKRASGFIVAIKSGEGAAKAIAVNAVDLVVDLDHGVKNLSVNAAHMASSMNNIASAMAPVATSAGIAAGIVTGLELCYITYKFFIGDISDWAAYGRLVTRSIATGVTSVVGNCCGYLAGALVGGGIGMVAGPGGAAAGAFIGAVIGSIFGSIVRGASAAYAFDKCWPDNEQKSRKKLVNEALMQYGYTENDVKIPLTQCSKSPQRSSSVFCDCDDE
ncbi:unnamed protein product [Didymodactylos carnosus]|uniref:Uncharacterized protein n=1 Tax=Didymodactylos carnosus TaxID=1234261 RepID=A0A8S2TV41_9BILA|nr:unnamed protein product [Didymodactylos carnosus]CAF4306364.1 unnamed protein product [Didymodactylos carnosus]